MKRKVPRTVARLDVSTGTYEMAQGGGSCPVLDVEGSRYLGCMLGMLHARYGLIGWGSAPGERGSQVALWVEVTGGFSQQCLVIWAAGYFSRKEVL